VNDFIHSLQFGFLVLRREHFASPSSLRALTRGIVLGFVVSLCFSSFSFCDSPPAWTKKRPNDPSYFIGIARSTTGQSGYRELAKGNALADLASEIEVQVNSGISQVRSESLGVFKDDVISIVQISSKADLDAFEIVDSWEGNGEFWIYYHLSKEIYFAKREQKKKTAIGSALADYQSAHQKVNADQIPIALGFLIQSLHDIRKYVFDDPVAIYEGTEIHLTRQIQEDIRQLLQQIHFDPSEKRIVRKHGIESNLDIPLRAQYGDEDTAHPIGYLPLRVSFDVGKGEPAPDLQTDKSGRVSVHITNLVFANDRILATIAPNLEYFVPRDSDRAITGILLRSFILPGSHFEIVQRKIHLLITSDEVNLGQHLNPLCIEPQIKQYLSDKGILFVDQSDSADILMNIQAISREGSVIYGQSICFADVTISLIALPGKEETFKQSVRDIKGIQLDNSKAGLKAIENAGKQVVSVILPKVMEKLQ
jgi:virulence-associated protein VapD